MGWFDLKPYFENVAPSKHLLTIYQFTGVYPTKLYILHLFNAVMILLDPHVSSIEP